MVDGLGELHPIDPLAISQWHHYGRVQITVKTSFKIKDVARSLISSTDYITAHLKYERLHQFCTICCSMGHDDISCTARKQVIQILKTDITHDIRSQLTKSMQPKINDSVRVNSKITPMSLLPHDTSLSSNTRYGASTMPRVLSLAHTNLANSGFTSKVSQQVCSTIPVNQAPITSTLCANNTNICVPVSGGSVGQHGDDLHSRVPAGDNIFSQWIRADSDTTIHQTTVHCLASTRSIPFTRSIPDSLVLFA